MLLRRRGPGRIELAETLVERDLAGAGRASRYPAKNVDGNSGRRPDHARGVGHAITIRVDREGKVRLPTALMDLVIGVPQFVSRLELVPPQGAGDLERDIPAPLMAHDSQLSPSVGNEVDSGFD